MTGLWKLIIIFTIGGAEPQPVPFPTRAECWEVADKLNAHRDVRIVRAYCVRVAPAERPRP